MKIFVDADSCPAKVRNIVTRASLRQKVDCWFVANAKIPVEKHQFVYQKVTSKEEGSADDYIVENAEAGDLVLTRDIPLADRLLSLDAIVINDRGDEFTKDTIKTKLAERDFMKTFYENGIICQGPKSFSNKELANFANCFDRILTRACNNL